MQQDKLDPIWKALSDPTRRRILEFLLEDSKTTTEVVDHFPNLTRFNVMKHLDVLRSARLVITEKEGRKRFNSLNKEPLDFISKHWFAGFEDEKIEVDLRKKPRRISQMKDKRDFGWKKYD